MGVLRRMSPLFRSSRRKSSTLNNVSAIEAEVDYIVQRSPFLKLRAQEEEEEMTTTTTTRAQHDDDETTAILLPPPTFTRKEYETGAILGSGSFSTVYAITGFKLSSSGSSNSTSSSSSSSSNKRRRRCSKTTGKPLLQKVSSISSCLTSDTSTFFTCAATAAPEEAAAATTRPDNNNNNNNEDLNENARIQLSQSVLDSMGDSRYAVKVVKKELLSKKKKKKKKGGSSDHAAASAAFRNAAADLIVEAKYLASLNHPNILKLRGIAKGGCSSYLDGRHDGFFMIVDRLQETLADRIQQWKMNNNNNNNLLLRQQANYALQMADALTYLHDRRILFRDLKPSNVGFAKDTPHTVQLFDFGLARELPPINAPPASTSSDYPDNNNNNNNFFLLEDNNHHGDDNDDHHSSSNNEAFQMSGAGTFVYMSPEAINSRTYNLKADVYSWSMVTLEMIALKRPFEEFTPEEHKEFVCEIGQRPSLEDIYCGCGGGDGDGDDQALLLPPSLQNLLRLAWEQDPIQRLTMKQVSQQLKTIIEDELQEQALCNY